MYTLCTLYTLYVIGLIVNEHNPNKSQFLTNKSQSCAMRHLHKKTINSVGPSRGLAYGCNVRAGSYDKYL